MFCFPYTSDSYISSFIRGPDRVRPGYLVCCVREVRLPWLAYFYIFSTLNNSDVGLQTVYPLITEVTFTTMTTQCHYDLPKTQDVSFAVWRECFLVNEGRVAMLFDCLQTKWRKTNKRTFVFSEVTGFTISSCFSGT